MGLMDLIGDQINQRLGVRPRQQSNFIDTELPAIAKGIQDAQTKEELDKYISVLAQSGLKAGMRMEGIHKLTEMLVGPAVENLRAGEIDKIRNDYGPQTTPLTPNVAPEGQGQQLPANTTFTPQTTPGKPWDTDAALRLAKFGKAPEGLTGLLEAPSKIAAENALAGQRKTTESLDADQSRALNALADTPIGDTGMTTRSLGQATKGGGLTQLLEQRAKPPDPLEEKKSALMDAQIHRLNRPPPEPKAPAATGAMKDFIAIGGNPQDEGAFMDFLAKRAEAQRKPSEMELYLRSKGKGKGTPTKATPGKKRSLEEIAKDAFK